MFQPDYAFLTPYLQNMMQSEALRQLHHTYTKQLRSPVISEPEPLNDWNQPEYQYPAPITNLPCFYVQRSKPIIQPQGLMSKNVPLLYVPMGDMLRRGDWVSNVQTTVNPLTGTQVLLLAGPLEVEDTSPLSPNVEGWILLIAQLREVKQVPDGRPPAA